MTNTIGGRGEQRRQQHAEPLAQDTRCRSGAAQDQQASAARRREDDAGDPRNGARRRCAGRGAVVSATRAPASPKWARVDDRRRRAHCRSRCRAACAFQISSRRILEQKAVDGIARRACAESAAADRCALAGSTLSSKCGDQRLEFGIRIAEVIVIAGIDVVVQGFGMTHDAHVEVMAGVDLIQPLRPFEIFDAARGFRSAPSCAATISPLRRA